MNETTRLGLAVVAAAVVLVRAPGMWWVAVAGVAASVLHGWCARRPGADPGLSARLRSIDAGWWATLLAMAVLIGASASAGPDAPTLGGSGPAAAVALVMVRVAVVCIDCARVGAGLGWLVAVFFVGYATLSGLTSDRVLQGDEPYFLLLSESLRSDFDLDLANNYAAGDSLRFMDSALEPQHHDPLGGRRSRHPPMLSLLLLPGYALAGRAGAILTMNLLAALLVGAVGRVALALDPEWGVRSAWAAAAVAGLTCPLLGFCGQIWTEVPATWLSLVLFGELLRRQGPRPLVALPCVVVLVLLKLRYGLIAVPVLGAGLLLNPIARPRALRLLVPVMALTAVVFAWNTAVYGRPLRKHSLWVLVEEVGYLPTGLSGFLLDQAHGVLPYGPHYALAALGLGWLLRRNRPAFLLWAVAVGPYLLQLGQLRLFGEWSPPGRYVLVVVGLAAPLVALGGRVAAGVLRPTAAAAVLWSVLVGLVVRAQPGLLYSVADGTSQLGNRLAVAVGADVVRFLPNFLSPGTGDRLLAALTWGVLLALGLVGWRRGRVPARSEGESSPPQARGGSFWLCQVPVAAVLVTSLLATLVAAARFWPTRVVELEHRQVQHSAGEMEPWLYAGGRSYSAGKSGWLHPPGAVSTAPVSLAAGTYEVWALARPGYGEARAQLAIAIGGHTIDLQVADDWRLATGRIELTAPATTLTVGNPGATSLIVGHVRLLPVAAR